MKLVRFGPAGEERPGLLLPGSAGKGPSAILDVRAMAFDISDYTGSFFERMGLARLRRLLLEKNPPVVPLDSVRLGPPIARPGKIVCLGKNYADHAMEFDAEIPESPIYFSKAVTSMIGPCDPVVLPREAKRVDGEVELAFVIGKTARRVPEADALAHVAGFTVLNDLTDRDAQRDGKQWFRGKSADTFCPIGPYLVTADELATVDNLNLYARVNGILLQESNTRNMIFKLPFLISHLSRAMTLEAGDVIATGTPGGIGSARIPPVLLKPGDVLETVIENIGRQINPVVAEPGG